MHKKQTSLPSPGGRQKARQFIENNSARRHGQTVYYGDVAKAAGMPVADVDWAKFFDWLDGEERASGRPVLSCLVCSRNSKNPSAAQWQDPIKLARAQKRAWDYWGQRLQPDGPKASGAPPWND